MSDSSTPVPSAALALDLTTSVVSDPDAPSDLLDDSAVVVDAAAESVAESPTHYHSPDDEQTDDDYDPSALNDESYIDDLEADSIDTPGDEEIEDEDDDRTDADEDLDKLIDGTADTIEKFLVTLEERLLNGESIIKLRRWARSVYKIEKKPFCRYLDIVRGTWRLEGTTLFVMQTRRDEYRAYCREIYRDAKENAKTEDGFDAKILAVGLKAIEMMAQLDGLTSPDVTVQINQMIAQSQGQDGANISPLGKAQLTNKVRERTQLLLQTMRDRAVQHSAAATRAISGARAHEGAGTTEDPLVVPSNRVMGAVK